MEPECICANRAKVESMVHPYCPRHAGGDPGPGIGMCQGPECSASADVIIGDGDSLTRLCTSCLLTAYLGAMGRLAAEQLAHQDTTATWVARYTAAEYAAEAETKKWAKQYNALEERAVRAERNASPHTEAALYAWKERSEKQEARAVTAERFAKEQIELRNATIDDLRKQLAAVTAERDEAYERGRRRGREDVGRLHDALAEIERVLGRKPAPVEFLARAVAELKREKEAAQSALARAMDAMPTAEEREGIGFAFDVADLSDPSNMHENECWTWLQRLDAFRASQQQNGGDDA